MIQANKFKIRLWCQQNIISIKAFWEKIAQVLRENDCKVSATPAQDKIKAFAKKKN